MKVIHRSPRRIESLREDLKGELKAIVRRVFKWGRSGLIRRSQRRIEGVCYGELISREHYGRSQRRIEGDLLDVANALTAEPAEDLKGELKGDELAAIRRRALKQRRRSQRRIEGMICATNYFHYFRKSEDLKGELKV